MTVKEFSENVASFNRKIENIAASVHTEAPLLVTAAMTQQENKMRNESTRNQLGLIRAIFLGASSTGKSTMINALAGSIIVPEVMHTSTMIPTWIGQTDNYADEKVSVTFFDINEDGKAGEELKEKLETRDDFRCYYCFRAEDAADPDRRIKPERFKLMELNEAYMRILRHEGLMSRYSMVLVDSLGNNATIADDIKAQFNMRDVDIAFVLLNSDGTVDKASRDFYAGTLFNKDVSHINPEHIIFVINKIDRAPSIVGSKKNCRIAIESILKVAYNNNIPEGLLEKLCSQIVPYSALYNRLVSAGLYPYKHDALKIYDDLSETDFDDPQTAEKEETVEIVSENTRFEKKLSRLSEEDLLEDGHCKDLERVLSKVIADVFADGTIVENHLQSPESIALNLIQCVDERIRAFKAESQAVAAKIEKFNQVKVKLDELTQKFTDDTEMLCKEFPKYTNQYLKTHINEIIDMISPDLQLILESMDISAETRAKFPRAKDLAKLSVLDMHEIFVQEFSQDKDKLVSSLGNLLSGLIFSPQARVGTDEGDVVIATAPYNRFYKLAMQSINNYVTGYLDLIESINDDKSFKIVTVDKKVYEKIINEQMSHLILRLIQVIQGNVDKLVDDTMAQELHGAIHGFTTWWHIVFKGKDVDYFFNKLIEAARNFLTAAVTVHIKNTVDTNPGFIGMDLGLEIYGTLHKMIPSTANLMQEYRLGIEHELEDLEKKQSEYQQRQKFYDDFADNQVVKPLTEMLDEIDVMRKAAVNDEIVL